MILKIIETEFSVVQYSLDERIPEWALKAKMVSITRTNEELSIAAPSSVISEEASILQKEDEWRGIKIEGPLDFSLIGILTSIANPLAENGISIFALSTYNTDYVLVKKESFEKAKIVLEKEGHELIEE